MRGLVVLTAALLAVGGASASGSAGGTALTITYWENPSSTTAKVTWTLRCNPAGGTLKRPGIACRLLASRGRALFAPLPRGQVCTQIYGGPQAALVAGTLDGRRVFARFQRRNGCEIARWSRVSPWLLPPGGVT
jgi:hypothetical protein